MHRRRVLLRWHRRIHRPPCVASGATGAGIDHGELAQLARPLLDGVPQGSATREPPSQYVGGDYRSAQASGESHALLAFEVSRMWHRAHRSVSRAG